MSFLSKFGQRLIEARQREARARVNAILRDYDPQMLKRAGISRSETENPVGGAYFF